MYHLLPSVPTIVNPRFAVEFINQFWVREMHGRITLLVVRG